MGNLQSAVHELSAIISKLGEELIEQKKIIASADGQVIHLRSENQSLKRKIAELSGDTLPEDFAPLQSLSGFANLTDEDYLLTASSTRSLDDDVKYTSQLDEDEILNY